MNNKGFSLIELVVAMGIGSIVLLMISVMLVRGTSIFREENNDVNTRNDYQLIRNQLDQAIMEAKSLVIETQGSDIIIYTGEIGVDREFTAANLSTERVITYDRNTKSLYISSTYDNHKAEGNIITDIVEDFKIEISNDTKTEVVDGVETSYYVNPVRVDIELKLKNEKSSIASAFTINFRNRISKIAKYNTANGNEGLNAAITAEEYRVK